MAPPLYHGYASAWGGRHRVTPKHEPSAELVAEWGALPLLLRQDGASLLSLSLARLLVQEKGRLSPTEPMAEGSVWGMGGAALLVLSQQIH